MPALAYLDLGSGVYCFGVLVITSRAIRFVGTLGPHDLKGHLLANKCIEKDDKVA